MKHYVELVTVYNGDEAPELTILDDVLTASLDNLMYLSAKLKTRWIKVHEHYVVSHDTWSVPDTEIMAWLVKREGTYIRCVDTHE